MNFTMLWPETTGTKKTETRQRREMRKGVVGFMVGGDLRLRELVMGWVRE
jgi:hypothetical protein